VVPHAGAGHALTMFEFDYRLTGTGRAEARIADEHGHAVVTASYLSDALRSLLDGSVLVVEGNPRTSFSWDEEPREYRWLVARAETGSSWNSRVRRTLG
jgi:hypothetical protein